MHPRLPSSRRRLSLDVEPDATPTPCRLTLRRRSQTHLCIKCDCPIAQYGRLRPCGHTFCLQCAFETGRTCYLCFQQVEQVERVSGTPFVCGVCLVSFDTLRELAMHTQAAHVAHEVALVPHPAGRT